VSRKKSEPPNPKPPSQEPPVDLDLRTSVREGPLEHGEERFRIFLIDSGWNGPVSKAVRQHLPLIYQFQRQDTLFILTPEQSVAVLKHAPYMIGHDPTILVYDRFASKLAGDPEDRSFKGFRLNLGLIRHPEPALARLNEFVRFLCEHRTAECLSREVKREMHREGLNGIVKILRDGLEAGIELV
jgi:hypothetical protein